MIFLLVPICNGKVYEIYLLEDKALRRSAEANWFYADGKIKAALKAFKEILVIYKNVTKHPDCLPNRRRLLSSKITMYKNRIKQIEKELKNPVTHPPNTAGSSIHVTRKTNIISSYIIRSLPMQRENGTGTYPYHQKMKMRI
jgi:hypothetical protein